MTILIRPYADPDETGWLRCRVLSFLGTQYFDDVKTRPTTFELPAVRLVAEAENEIAGILDVEIDGGLATIDTIAVHPDHARKGIASALLDAALPELSDRGATEVDAWTREDPVANAWYQATGFAEAYRYLHVYKGWDEPSDGLTAPDGLTLQTAFLHAPVERETELRARFARVHICRRYLRPLEVPSTGNPR
ncbi:GNAT family N-acetyltransferase [Antribacter gilvus]|uniref:GNAT family N-acetyltransferase n=1 Tax=Antribacter gilvus TaxID=2304675 RepID=UPI000F7A3465|nr:GNAT family N-acetyltransferase [Antribacter gilvus]